MFQCGEILNIVTEAPGLEVALSLSDNRDIAFEGAPESLSVVIGTEAGPAGSGFAGFARVPFIAMHADRAAFVDLRIQFANGPTVDVRVHSAFARPFITGFFHEDTSANEIGDLGRNTSRLDDPQRLLILGQSIGIDGVNLTQDGDGGGINDIASDEQRLRAFAGGRIVYRVRLLIGHDERFRGDFPSRIGWPVDSRIEQRCGNWNAEFHVGALIDRIQISLSSSLLVEDALERTVFDDFTIESSVRWSSGTAIANRAERLVYGFFPPGAEETRDLFLKKYSGPHVTGRAEIRDALTFEKLVEATLIETADTRIELGFYLKSEITGRGRLIRNQAIFDSALFGGRHSVRFQPACGLVALDR